MSSQLYRHFDRNGKLLYVGISLSTIERLRRHKQVHARWFRRITSITVEHYRSRQDAHRAELMAIGLEKPLHNAPLSWISQMMVERWKNYR